MEGKLRANGHGFFIILPDIPSCDSPCLPSICFRRSHGLLARVSQSNESEKSIYEAIRLFNSKEGERVEQCSCSANCLDSMTVCEEFVENVDRFVTAMDGVSNGGFLSGEVSGLGSDWIELDWLKAKGYYSVQAFVANRLEVALRLSWLNCNNGKKRGVKLKEKAGVAGVAANVYWRKKGCMDWWGKLDAETKRIFFQMILRKGAKSLTAEILKGANSALEDEMWLFGAGAEQSLKYKHAVSCPRTIRTPVGTDLDFGLNFTPPSVSEKISSLSYVFNSLFVLQDILAFLLACQHNEYNQEKLFFSSLGSVSTISDCVSRKLRGLLMIISLDCTKLELLEEEKLKKSKEKPCATSRRKKGKTHNMKRVNPVARPSGNDISLHKLPKDHGSGLAHTESVDTIKSNSLIGTLQKKDSNGRSPLPATDMECGQELVNGDVQTAGKEGEDINCRNVGHFNETDKKSVSPGEPTKAVDPEEKLTPIKEQERGSNYDTGSISSSGCPSYEWPTVAPVHFPSVNSHLPAATDRLHLDVGHNWHNHFRRSFVQTVHQARNSSIENGGNRIVTRPLPLSSDWPPMEDERMYSGDFVDLSDLRNPQELADELDNHWISEEEFEVHAVSGMDYNQYFGGGVMYWNPSDHPGTSFSRPPSLSSDDSSWAWREADINRAVDDMVAFSSSYSTNGLTSPSTASFCSPFDPLGPAHPALGYVIPGSEVTSKVLHASSTVTDVAAEESASGSLSNLPDRRSDFKRNHDRKSPCVPPTRREQPRIKRPPSPIVLCVPHAPRLPPPSPVGDSRKHRGFPTVRSGSSSPRQWGVRGWFHDGINFEEACACMDGSEVVWPSWRNKSLSAHPMVQPLSGALLQDRLIAISQLARDQEHPDVAFPLQPPELLNCPTRKASLSLLHSILHDEIDSFCKQVAAENMIRKPYINWAVKRVTRDVDLVVCLPPVRNLEPIKEAGILEGRNGIKETCLQHAARYLANQEWVKNDSLKTVENTAIPIIMLVVEVPHDLITTVASNVQKLKEEPTQMNNDNGKDAKSVRLDISFKSAPHTGLQTTELVKELTEQFPAVTPLALVLKQFLADRSLDQSYSGGLSSYCLVLLITRFLQHEYHHGRPINQNFGSLLMDFLYFFGNVFDPRLMRISVQGSGVYINRERGYSIDPIYIDDPLFPANNVGRNCFRIHQCIKAFADAYSILENELACISSDGDSRFLYVWKGLDLTSHAVASFQLIVRTEDCSRSLHSVLQPCCPPQLTCLVHSKI
ncbi:hypothetical protein F0562_014737 [Nyssa sinensis]|uniref:PAP-associated domain-containing protein n=1 Tax=Nyssa sinensis TaxID=561372 RepID=A0A5J4ZTQ0_9ASTE|nr:hypothetical protein F0562_014737 [Nyssa sinensis]